MKFVVRPMTLTLLTFVAGVVQAADNSKLLIEGHIAAWNAHDAEKSSQFFANDGVYAVSFIRIANGKITYQGDYYDALGFNKQLGW